ncbi:MAG: hypothetical protein L6R41_003595 [Letrouitia leprolyta]|nr:MAG: hypothetical protein L6R41_003595 [Letrouitia leprolyta]
MYNTDSYYSSEKSYSNNNVDNNTIAGYKYDSSRLRIFGDLARRGRRLNTLDGQLPLLNKRTSPPPARYLSSVKCIKTVQVIYFKKVIVVKPTITRTVAGSTITATTTRTFTSTRTVCPPGVTSTTTFSTIVAATTTVTSTITQPATTTQTETLLQDTTSYAACATNNVLDPRLNDGTYTYLFNINDPDVQYNQKPAINGYKCCVAYVTSDTCEFSVYVTSKAACINIENVSACPAQPFFASTFQQTVEDTRITSFYSNGRCGQMQSEGIVTP